MGANVLYFSFKISHTFEELEKYVDSYIYYYNNERPQWTKKKMTPVEYRNHLLGLKKQA
jgi:hypothetical protein